MPRVRAGFKGGDGRDVGLGCAVLEIVIQERTEDLAAKAEQLQQSGPTGQPSGVKASHALVQSCFRISVSSTDIGGE